MNGHLSKVVSVLSAVTLAYCFGFVASHFQWFPHALVQPALDELQALTRPEGHDQHYKHPVRYSLHGALAPGPRGSAPPVPQPDTEPGVTLLTSFWRDQAWQPGIKLIDRSGRTLHRWPVPAHLLWPASTYSDAAGDLMSRPDNYVHGSYLFPNGDVLACVEFLGLVRLSAAGQPIWKLDRRTHHAIAPTDDANFWVCAARWLDELSARRRFPELGQTLWEDTVLLVSPAGEIKREISILEVIYKSRHRALIWDQQFNGPNLDLLHLNDVEPLSAAMASEYPLFKAGDLMISLRDINLVCVFDPDTGAMKWSAPGTFTKQHDPDFIGDGWISVYDNNTDQTEDGSRRGGSKLMAIRPHSGEIKQIYPPPLAANFGERRFYSARGGKAQRLDSGGWLLSEPTAGRVFEIDCHGRTVWEWGQDSFEDGRTVPEVLEGTRYALTPEQVRRWSER